MNIKIISGITVAILIVASVFYFSKNNSSITLASPLGDHNMEIYKTPTCGCCGIYGSYMDKEGVTTNVHNLYSLDEVKEKYNIPMQYQSCHTSEVAGYFVEGHIPLSVVEKLVNEKPDIKGIMLPGMPSGTPGMPGPKTEDWKIYQMHNNGEVSEYITL